MKQTAGINQNDQYLIRQTIEGNRSAFGELVEKYQHRLFNGLYHIVQNQTEAEDVVQETFVLAFTKLNTFQGNSSFFTWIYRIGYNVAVSRYRRRKKTVSLDNQSELGFTLIDSVDGPSHRVEQQELASQIESALHRLSEEHRSILVLREIEDLDYEAISEILDLSIGTVRSRLHRAREQLREQLKHIMEQHNVS